MPVETKTIDEWVYPPFSGYFDGKLQLSCIGIKGDSYRSVLGERIWGRGSSDDKSGLIGVLHVLFYQFPPAPLKLSQRCVVLLLKLSSPTGSNQRAP